MSNLEALQCEIRAVAVAAQLYGGRSSQSYPPNRFPSPSNPPLELRIDREEDSVKEILHSLPRMRAISNS
ncbi:hypothetical protein CDL15_Pgr026371 [Punica granatum]|nr:hypothetical protein CDL15_Pgr026371 [Punica granatum]